MASHEQGFQSMEMSQLISAMGARFPGEARAATDIANGHGSSFHGWNILPREHIYSTGAPDCAFLYLLIRYFNCRNIFEVGTNIGTSAVSMNAAARKNGGVLTTTDPIDYGAIPPWSGIRFIRGPADLGLHILKSEGHKIDFCFFDWLPTAQTLHALAEITEENAILATHDYADAGSKGYETVKAIEAAGLQSGRHWILPGKTPDIIDGVRVNFCTAVCIPI